MVSRGIRIGILSGILSGIPCRGFIFVLLKLLIEIVLFLGLWGVDGRLRRGRRQYIPQNLGAALRLSACLGVVLDVIEPCGFPLTDTSMKRAART